MSIRYAQLLLPNTCMAEKTALAWWRHQMKTFSALLAICAGKSPVSGEIPAQRPVTRSFDVFFDLRLNKRLSKQWWGWWFETLSRPLWCHFNGLWLMPTLYQRDNWMRHSFPNVEPISAATCAAWLVCWALLQYKDRLFSYGDFHHNDNTVAGIDLPHQCVVDSYNLPLVSKIDPPHQFAVNSYNPYNENPVMVWQHVCIETAPRYLLQLYQSTSVNDVFYQFTIQTTMEIWI